MREARQGAGRPHVGDAADLKAKGRPRLTPEELQARIDRYCARYGVTPNAEGLPPFPSGRRETPQHRDWIAVYKAHNRLGRRQRGQCERCSAPASDGSVFCDEHRGEATGSRVDGPAATDDRRARLDAQDGRCPICGQKLQLAASVDHYAGDGRLRAVLHASCQHLVGLAEAAGPEGLDRLRAYLWPKVDRGR